jgi:hypothetical protein
MQVYFSSLGNEIISFIHGNGMNMNKSIRSMFFKLIFFQNIYFVGNFCYENLLLRTTSVLSYYQHTGN